jgi:beta-phosphoglucomutase-like phosphatase (HAD superfamily)
MDAHTSRAASADGRAQRDFTTMPAAVLWDMDGTLIDTEPYWIAAETELANRHGVTWTYEDGLSLVGMSLVHSARILQERGIALEVNEILDYLVVRVTAQVRSHVPWQPDARALLGKVVEAGIPCALVTMSYKPLADAFLSAASEAFSVVVTGEQVERGKPDPESYLKAADALGVPVASCIAIEDSPSGIASAYTAGAVTIGVRRLVPVEPRPGLRIVDTLDGIEVETLTAMVTPSRAS